MFRAIYIMCINKNKCRFSYLKTAKNGTYLLLLHSFLFRANPTKSEKVTLKVTLNSLK